MKCRCGDQMVALGTLEKVGTAETAPETALVWSCGKCDRILIQWSSRREWYMTGTTDDGRAYAMTDFSGLPQPPRRREGEQRND